MCTVLLPQGVNPTAVNKYIIMIFQLGLNTDSKPLLYADDTSVLLNGNSLHDLQVQSVTVLNCMSKKLTVNG